MSIQFNLLDSGMQLNDARNAFYAEHKEPQPDLDMMGQLVEDFRDALDALDNQARSLRGGLRRMERTLHDSRT